MVTRQKLGNTPIAPNKELIRNIRLIDNSLGVFYDDGESGNAQNNESNVRPSDY